MDFNTDYLELVCLERKADTLLPLYKETMDELRETQYESIDNLTRFIEMSKEVIDLCHSSLQIFKRFRVLTQAQRISIRKTILLIRVGMMCAKVLRKLKT